MCNADPNLLNRLENAEILGDLKSHLNLNKPSILNQYQPSLSACQNNDKIEMNTELNKIKETMNLKINNIAVNDERVQIDKNNNPYKNTIAYNQPASMLNGMD